MAGETGVFEINPLAVDGVALRADLIRRHDRRTGAQNGHGERSEGETLGPDHRQIPQRGSVTTSTTAGSPLLTTAMARASAGPRSFGSVIGPSPWTPMPRATVA